MPQSLKKMPCFVCEKIARQLIQASCDLRVFYEVTQDGKGDGKAAAKIVNLVMEIVAGSPSDVGRIADKCDDTAELLGVASAGSVAADAPVSDGVTTLCRAHGCEAW